MAEVDAQVPVFESMNDEELRKVQDALSAKNIAAAVDDNLPDFPPAPPGTKRLMVPLRDESKAFEIIDEYLKQF
ncbi:MAG: DUF2007 domain-containing protein [Chryseobacterium sp.]|nr:MAG: DUF2007 domain-containing protein [Chryseobacterium sp.]